MTPEEKEQILKLNKENKTNREISEILNLPFNTVRCFLKRTESTTFCKFCGKKIINKPGKKPKIFCCDKCRNKWWNNHLEQVNKKAYHNLTCINCGKEFLSYSKTDRLFCCHSCYINYRFKEHNNDKK